MTYTTNTRFSKQFILLGLGLLLFAGAFAQTKYSSKNGISIEVNGTSTLHDWEMKSADGSFDANFTQTATGAITAVNGMSFTTNPKALKSGKSAMDNNAYKALKTDKAPSISFIANTSTVTAVDATTYIVKATGKLSIAGAVKDTEISAKCKVNADKTISVTGERKISMKDFSMEPPSFMMGTIKTGNDVTIKFDLKLSK